MVMSPNNLEENASTTMTRDMTQLIGLWPTE